MPVFQNEDDEKDFKSWFDGEYVDAEAEIQRKAEKWDQFKLDRTGKSDGTKKTYPFPGASNVKVPISLINTNTTYGHLKQVFMIKDPFWTIKARKKGDSEETEKARVIQKYMNMQAEGRHDLNLREKEKTILYEVASIGFCWIKIPWVEESKKYKVSEGAGTESIEAEVRKGPGVVPIPPEDAIYPEGYESVEMMPWFAHRVHIPRHELVNRGNRGVYDPEGVDGVKEYLTEEVAESDYDEEAYGSPELVDLLEVWFYWEDENGDYVDCVVTYHKASGIILREGFNPLGYRPFACPPYLHKSFEVGGIGSCELGEQMQSEADTLHNMRIDNAHIAGQKMFAAKRGSGVKTREKMYPGKIWFVDNPKEDLVPLSAGEIYPSSLQAEQGAVQYAQRATGMPDAMAGFSDQTLGTRDTASGQAMRLKQSKGIFNSIIEGLEDTFSDIGEMVLRQLVLNRDIVINKERRIGRLTERELKVLNEALDIQPHEIPLRLTFGVQTTEIDQTFEVKRQNMLSLSQLYSQYAGQILEMQQVMMNPQAPEGLRHVANQVYVGASKIMEKIIELFNVDDPSHYIPDYKLNEVVTELKDTMSGLKAEQLKEKAHELEENAGGGVSGNTGRGRFRGSTGDAEGATGEAVRNPRMGVRGEADLGAEGASGSPPGSGGPSV